MKKTDLSACFGKQTNTESVVRILFDGVEAVCFNGFLSGGLDYHLINTLLIAIEKESQLKGLNLIMASAMSCAVSLSFVSNAVVSAPKGERFIIQFEDGRSNAGRSALNAAGASIARDLMNHNAVAAHVPAAALQGLSRNRTLIVAWGGNCEDGVLTYAEPGHPEYRRYERPEALIVSAP